jgi:preprotein translocase subunit SecA
VLNAKLHEQEANIVAQAGRLGAVTVATNMAGRGTDIVLGGSPAGRDPGEWEEEHRRVVALGGLQILGTERHESRRIDNQLRGRAGRQGDPGASLFYVSLEDELMRRFGGERVKGLMSWAGLDPATPIDNNMVRSAFENAQVKVEAFNFEIRKRLVEYDDVINTQRDIIYKERRRILQGEDLTASIQEMVQREVEGLALAQLPDSRPESWDVEGLAAGLGNLLGAAPEWTTPEEMDQMTRDEALEALRGYAEERYAEREGSFGPPLMREVERLVSLQTIDMHWVEHLTAMDTMRQGIGLEAVGQRDPLVAYRTQAHQMYQQLQELMQGAIVRNLFHVTIRREPATRAASPLAAQQRNSRGEATAIGGNGRGGTRTAVRARQKVGRNDLCPCGSGKKYKRCHGANT